MNPIPSSHRIAWATLMLVVGLVFLVFTLQVHLALAFCGFLVMLTAAFIIDKNARAIGRAGFDQVTGRVRGSRQRDGQGGTARPVDTDD
jgi:hypothetical protein